MHERINPCNQTGKILDAIATEIDSPITPVTREEKILVAIADKSNIDFTPATRKEYFLNEVLRNEQPHAQVDFLSFYNQVIASVVYTIYDTIVFPRPWIQRGYLFIGWNMDEDAIKAAMQNGDEHISVKPVYEYNAEETVAVTIKYENGLHEDEERLLPYNNIANLEATEIPGYRFECWKDSDGYTLSAKESYAVKLQTPKELTAIYVDENSPVTEKRPITAMVDAAADIIDGESTQIYLSTASIPDGYAPVKHGIVRSVLAFVPSDNLSEQLVIGGENVKIHQANTSDYDNTFELTLTRSSESGKASKVYARAFVIVEKDGEQETIYSDNIFAYSYNDLIEEA